MVLDVNWDHIFQSNKIINNKKKPILRSNGKFLRDYLYIDDVVNGYVLIGKTMMKSNKLNGLAIEFWF